MKVFIIANIFADDLQENQNLATKVKLKVATVCIDRYSTFLI